ncbi:MAG: DUF418 domain-containing protein [Chitinophagaceae bacterium]|nr:DUF418 domain-containing protein [Chitinophagaceae bacterium]
MNGSFENEMRTAASPAAPLDQTSRIAIIDVLRGVALLGILLMNILGFSNPYRQISNLELLQEYSGPNYYTWWIVATFFEGTMRAIFSMLFGAGCILLISRLEKRDPATAAGIYFRRLLWLLLFGLTNAYILLWPGDILYEYAICGMFLYAFIKATPRLLLWCSAAVMLICIIIGTSGLQTLRQQRLKGEQALALEKSGAVLNEEQKASAEAWKKAQKKIERYREESAAEIAKKQKGSYAEIFLYHTPFIAEIESSTFYHEYFFDDMVVLFLGMALFKLGVLTAQRSRRFYLLLMLAGYLIGIPLSWYEHLNLVNMHFDGSRLLDKLPLDVYQPRRISLALGHIGLIITLYKAGIFKNLLRWLSRVGQMAFTNYLMQSICCAIIFYGFGFRMFGKLERYQEYYFVFGIWLFQIIFSNLWLKYFRFGPLEWVWRSLTYWRKQPLKRTDHLVTGSPA